MKQGSIDITIIMMALMTMVMAGVSAFIFTQIQDNLVEAAGIREDIDYENRRRARYDSLLRDYATIEEEGVYFQFGDLLPNEDNFIEVINELESMASSTNNIITMRLGDSKLTVEGLETVDTAPARQAGGQNYDYILVEATLRGNYSSIRQFLNLFRQSSYFMNIDSIALNKSQTDAGTFLDANIEIQIFVQKVIRN